MTLIDRPTDPIISHEAAAGAERSRPFVNVGGSERAISIAAGAVLIGQGFLRRTLPGFISIGVGAAMLYRGLSGNCPAYSALGLNTADTDEDTAEMEEEIAAHGIHVEQAFLINRPPEALYAYWRNFENLPHIMSYLKSVRVLDERRSHWITRAPAIAGGAVEWEAEITHDEPNREIAWRSLPGSQVEHIGRIRFEPAPADRGTEVHVYLDYRPPAGRAGHWIARLFGKAPGRQMREDLRNFKRIMELGELPTTEGQPRGTCRRSAS